MANFQSIAATARSLERFLNHAFQSEQPVPGWNTTAVVVRTEDFTDSDRSETITRPALTIFLYRVDANKTMRAAWSSVGNRDGRAHLPLDLHFLLTPWANNANHEHRILGRTMQCLEQTPILSGPLLNSLDVPAGWSPYEAVQICLEELSTEDVMRTFDSLPTDFKLSVPYLARIVRIDTPVDVLDRPTTRLVAGITSSSEP